MWPRRSIAAAGVVLLLKTDRYVCRWPCHSLTDVLVANSPSTAACCLQVFKHRHSLEQTLRLVCNASEQNNGGSAWNAPRQALGPTHKWVIIVLTFPAHPLHPPPAQPACKVCHLASHSQSQLHACATIIMSRSHLAASCSGNDTVDQYSVVSMCQRNWHGDNDTRVQGIHISSLQSCCRPHTTEGPTCGRKLKTSQVLTTYRHTHTHGLLHTSTPVHNHSATAQHTPPTHLKVRFATHVSTYLFKKLIQEVAEMNTPLLILMMVRNRVEIYPAHFR